MLEYSLDPFKIISVCFSVQTGFDVIFSLIIHGVLCILVLRNYLFYFFINCHSVFVFDFDFVLECHLFGFWIF